MVINTNIKPGSNKARGGDERTHIVLPGAGGGVCGCLRPVGEVCVVGFHGGPGLDLCRQVNQIVRRLQGIGGVGGDVAVDVVGECAAAVAGVGVRQGGSRADALAGLGPGPAADIAGILRHGAGDGRAVVTQGHGEDVGRSLLGRPGGQPALDVPAVRGSDGVGVGAVVVALPQGAALGRVYPAEIP